VVDDEVNLPTLLKDFLEESGYTVDVAYNGKLGLRSALSNPPDAILLDVDLPDIDGYSLCRTMRRTSALRNRPIIMFTALDDPRNEIAGLRAGADDYLTKPIDTERLLARLSSAISRNIRELDANPLTHLPGNASILQEIERRILLGDPFAVIYGDLNNFKAFNDRYGFLRGDEAIKLAARAFVSAVEKQSPLGSGRGFVGHVGGDDFVVVVNTDQAQAICQDVIRRFDAEMPALYDEADRKNGYIEGKTRQGQVLRFPLAGIALVIVASGDTPFAHPGEISSLASELKSMAKAVGRSAYMANRRHLSGIQLETEGGGALP
jgi:diguanylate cyclase (GGDEF)-like protein